MEAVPWSGADVPIKAFAGRSRYEIAFDVKAEFCTRVRALDKAIAAVLDRYSVLKAGATAANLSAASRSPLRVADQLLTRDDFGD
jgi:hypothetical protein